MLKVAFDLLLLRKHPMEDFNFSVRHSIILITILGALTGLGDFNTSILNPLARIFIGLGTTWFVFFFGVKFIGWWLKKKQYWNKEGSLFNVLAAASLIDIVSAALTVCGLPLLITLPLHIYSLIVFGNAVKGATNSGLGYAILGLVLWTIVVMVIVVIIGLARGFLFL
ncbi:MAG: hypothetical protein JRJ44_04060 [Deltaproteobacteria bacterium]|nr:hypothetical protein [Deltaproteobacteria bacterium]